MIRRARQAEELAAALDGRAPLARDLTVAPLLSLAQSLQALPLGPRPEFRDALRTRLLAVAAVGVAEQPISLSPRERAGEWIEGWRVQRSIAAASAGMAAVVGIAGVGIAGSRSLPGDPFYGVKRGTEGVQVALARGDVAKGTKLLQHAETRLDEVARLVDTELSLGSTTAAGTVAIGGSTTEHVVDALEEMNELTARGSRLLTTAYEQDREPEPLQVLAAFAERQKRRLAEVVPALPDGSRAAAGDSLRLIAEVEMRANALLNNGMCGESCTPAAPVDEPDVVATPRPEPQPTPSADELGPQPCTCASARPTPQPSDTSTDEPTSRPTSRPTSEPTSAPTPTSSPSPTDEPSHVPVPLPEPVASAVEEIIDEVEDLLPTPLPTMPMAPDPQPAAPPIPGAPKP